MKSTPLRNMAGKWLVAAFLLLASAIGALWFSAISAYEDAVLRDRGRELQAVAALKIEIISFWLNERRADADVQAGRLLMARALVPRPGRAGSYGPEDIRGQLAAVQKAYDYEAVLLVDHAGNTLVGAGTVSEFAHRSAAKAALAAMASGQSLVSHAYHAGSGEHRHIDIDIAAPVVDGERTPAPIVGALVFHLDPREHLDPLMQRWPGTSDSGETFLFERAGKEIVYLSSLKHARAEELRKSIDETTLPAAHAAHGIEGLVEGIDYRGAPVLAAVGQVPGMPWFLVAKLDREEILAPVRREMIWSGSLSALLVLGLGLAMYSWRRRSWSEVVLAQRTASREALASSETRFRKLLENAWDFHALFNRDMDFRYSSPSINRYLGHDAAGRGIGEGTALVHPDDVPAVEAARQQALHQPGVPQSVEHRLADGKGGWLTVEASFTNYFDDPDIGLLSYVARDISGRVEAERILRERVRLQEQLFKIANSVPGMIYSFRLRPDGSSSMPYTGPGLVDLYGLRPEDIAGDASILFMRNHPDDLARLNASIAESARNLTPWHEEWRYRHPVKGERWLEGRSMPEREPDGSTLWQGFVMDVTERKQAEVALRDSEERYRFLFELSPDAVFVHRNNGILYANDAAVRLFRADSEAALIGRDWHDLVIPEDWAEIEARIASLMSGEETFLPPSEKRYVALNGQALPVEAKAARIVLDGQAAIMSVVRDITKRKQAEAELKESEERYRFLFEDSPLPMWVFDTDTLAFLQVNRTAVAQYGYSRDEFLSMTLRDIRPPEDVASLEASLATAHRPGGRIWTHRRKDGSLIKVAIWSQDTPLFGQPARMVLAEDVTARVDAEQALAESEARLRAIFDSAPVGIAIADANGRYLMVNQAQCRMLGYSEAELLSGTFADVTHADDVQMNLELGARVQRGEIGIGSLEKRYVRKDGSAFWVLLTLGMVRTASGEVIGSVGVAQDITERREAEARRLEYARQQRDTLVREVHHRIKNHLQGLAGLLRQHMREKPELAAVLQKFAAQVSAISIVHGLQGRAEKGDASLRNLVAEIAAFLEGITGARIGLTCPDKGCQWSVAETEAVPLALILNELLTNALRHGTDNTRVGVSVLCDGSKAQLVIRNPGRLGAGLDFAGGKGLGTGLTLIRSLLPPNGFVFSLCNTDDGWVESRLELMPPVLMPAAQVVSLR